MAGRKVTEAQLEALKPTQFKNADEANAAREKGLVVRRRNKMLREQFAISAKEAEEFGAINVLRGLLQHHIDAQDFDKAADIAKAIAEYETPKLQRQEINQTTELRDLTDEELAEELKKLG